MPNSSIGDRGQYLRNIDVEARLRKVDLSESKCDNKAFQAKVLVGETFFNDIYSVLTI